VAFFIGDLQTTWDILHVGYMYIGCFLERTPYIGGGPFGILKEGVDP
jgi:hypothetical protein